MSDNVTLDRLVKVNIIAYAREKPYCIRFINRKYGAHSFSKETIISTCSTRTDNEFSEKAYACLKTDFVDHHHGLVNGHRPMILEINLDWWQIGLSE
ncbi:MAG: hypothetical protein ACTS73_07200 [Arsenophonus sp. NEOnobi-MAG3]